MMKDNGVDDDDDDCVSTKGLPTEVMWYLPIISSFQRLVDNVNDANNIRWHVDKRKYDGKFCHVDDYL